MYVFKYKVSHKNRKYLSQSNRIINYDNSFAPHTLRTDFREQRSRQRQRQSIHNPIKKSHKVEHPKSTNP
jgi:hypothetical protein